MKKCKQALNDNTCDKDCCCYYCEDFETCEHACSNFDDKEELEQQGCEEQFDEETALQEFNNDSNALAIMQQISIISKKKKELEENEKEVRKALEAAMAQFGIKSFENDILKVVYVAPTTKTTIDSKALKKDKEADLLIKYITSQIDKLYTGGDYVQQDVFVYLDNNYLKARVSCENNIPKVDVDVDSGYLQVIEDSNTKEFVLKDEDLIVKDK